MGKNDFISFLLMAIFMTASIAWFRKRFFNILYPTLILYFFQIFLSLIQNRWIHHLDQDTVVI